MLFNFSDFKLDKYNRVEIPTVILATPNKVLLGALGIFSHAPHFELKLNDISTVEFEIPAHYFDDDGERQSTPLYDSVVGKMLLKIDPIGFFRITNPVIINEGLDERKVVKAFSLEDELNDTTISAWEGTFPLFRPSSDAADSVLGMITALRPSWRVGRVSPAISGAWRTFQVTTKSLYEFIKDDLQKLYQAVFTFDTYERTINVSTIEELASGSILSLSHDKFDQ